MNVTVHSPTLLSLLLYHNLCSFSNLSVTSPTSQRILQPFRRFTYVTAHSPILPLLHLRHNSFSNPSIVLSTPQLILPNLPLLHLRHSSFSNPSFASPTSQALNLIHLANHPWCASLAELIPQPLRHFSYVTTHSPTLPSLYVRHTSFSNPSVASPTSQLILQPFFRFSYVTSSLLNLPGEPPMGKPTIVKKTVIFFVILKH